jgi:ATP-dependent Lhr-like helicase
VGALVVLVDGYPAAYLRRGERELLLLVPDAEPQRSTSTRATAKALMTLARSREEGRRGLLISEINGVPASTHPLSHLFVAEGFNATAMGLQARVPIPARAEVPIVLGSEQVSG